VSINVPTETIRQLADAVEAQGGDLDDVRDLVETWRRVNERLAAACDQHNDGNEDEANAAYDDLAAEFGEPLDRIAHDHLHRKRGDK